MNIMSKFLTFVLLATCAFQAQSQDPRVWLDTDQGPIIIELDPGAAPITVENFLRYVDDGFYDGLIFHRVLSGFVIQGGGFDDHLDFQDDTYEAIVNEADNGLSNLRGTLAMARTSNPDSATSQFFINLEDNLNLDPGADTDEGYAVFGEVVHGMSTVDAIAQIPTSSITSPVGTLQQFPRNPPVILRAARTDGFPLMPQHSGSWYDPDNSGVGFNIEIANDAGGNGPLALVYWYNFDEQRQFWLIGSSSFEYGASEVTVDLQSHPGTDEGVEFQNPPPPAEFDDYGTLTLSFDDCSSGTVAYDMPGYGSGEIAVTRLSTPDGYKCEAL